MLEIAKTNLMDFFAGTFSNFNFWSFIKTRVSFVDVIDILIVAYFIYKIILWIKETRAWSLFKGTVVVLIFAAFSFIFGLTTISWIIKTTFNVGIIAVIVLFQPELRKALEQLGRGKFVMPFMGESKTNGYVLEDTSDELIKAAFAMAKVRTGALIVVEREVKLGDLEATGIPVDALVSSSLLLNIFEDKTPLHDGAVIIRNNRIAAASCILPITEREIGKDLGTRHRAAVGASELSDAIALIVSEESGRVSVAVGGDIYKNQSPDEVRRFLIGDEKEKQKKNLPFFLRRHKDDR